MSRVTVAVEGSEYPSGRLEKGSLRVEDDQIPVTLGNGSGKLVGVASDFQRDDETGTITFNVDLTPEMAQVLSPSSTDFSIYLSPFVSEKVNGDPMRRLITEGRIRALTAIPLPGFPKAYLPVEAFDKDLEDWMKNPEFAKRFRRAQRAARRRTWLLLTYSRISAKLFRS